MNLAMRMLGPSVALMGRLRFTHKLLLVGGVFAVALAGLASAYIHTINRQLMLTQSERRGLSGFDEAAAVLGTLAEERHRYAQAMAVASETPGLLDEVLTRLATRVQALEQWSSGEGAAYATGAAAGMLRERVSDIADAAASAEPERVLAAFDTWGEAVLGWLEIVADQSQLVRDPQVESYYLMDATVFRLPVIAEKLASASETAGGVLSMGLVYASERATLTSLLYRINQEALRVENAVPRFADAAAAVDAQSLADGIQQALQATEGVLGTMRGEVLEASEIAYDASAFAAESQAARAQLWSAFGDATVALDRLLAVREARLSRSRAVAVAVTLATLGAAGYLFAGLIVSLARGLGTMRTAIDGMASGAFPAEVPVTSRDELRDMADGLQTVARRLDAFSAAQAEIYDRHFAGEISFRIDAEQFQGAYARMAEAVNQLAAEHLATSDRVVGIIEQYASGNLDERIESLPGERARISDAVDSVRERLMAIRDEILALGAAAARGEFSRRGDAARFSHAFHDMVQALNELMANAEYGLDEVGRVLSGLADGDLTRRMNGEFSGRYATLRDDAEVTVERLSALIAEIRTVAEGVDASAREIALGNADLSTRTEQQAANLEETASSVEEMTVTVKRNADNAEHANTLAVGAADVATRGGAVVAEVVSTMGEISASSRRIADIVGTIDGIAFQTNILALNAAVEAARAGEQGRGFAVVAAEVRTLAKRSAAAAHEIKSLIADSVGRVETGSALVQRAGSTMNDIVDAVKRVTDIMGEISLASREQSHGVEQINASVVQMDRATQQNAAMVEEASAAAQSASELSRRLNQLVTVFKLDPRPQATSPVDRSSPAGAAVPALRHA